MMNVKTWVMTLAALIVVAIIAIIVSFSGSDALEEREFNEGEAQERRMIDPNNPPADIP